MQISIVAPFYNEESSIADFYTELTRVLTSLGKSYELIFVDDGSQDGTLTKLQELAARDENLTVLGLSRNFGHQSALTAGLDVAEGDAVIVMDSDLQHPPAVIPEMLKLFAAGADIVYTIRADDRGEGFLKRITSRVFYSIFKRFANIEVIPGSADFRLMRREVVDTLKGMRERHRYLRGMIPWTGWASAVLPYQQPQRKSGKSKYTFRKSLRLARHGLFSFSTIPLEIITWTGLFLSILGGIYLLYILIVSLMGKVVEGWTSTISTILILGGIQVLSLGVVAQYIGMIFEEVKGRPLYIIKSVHWSKHRGEGGERGDQGSPESR